MAKEPFATKLTSLWIGGFFFQIIKGFSGKLINMEKNMKAEMAVQDLLLHW